MRRVRVFFLGGTIAMTRAGTPGHGALEPELGGPRLLAGVPTPAGVVVDPVDVASVDSSALTFETCLDTFARADAAVRQGEADGVVVVQGTDTLEETAYLWDLLWPHVHPFVVTGAMRPPDVPGADGPANLLAAVTVAASEVAADMGVLVVIGDEAHAARHVAKRHTTSPSAFVSPDLGPVGRVQEAVPVLSARVPRHEPLPAPEGGATVAMLRASLDDDPALYRAAAEVSDGLVVDGFGAGQLRPEAGEVLARVARHKPVVLASRTGAGPVATRTYGGPGSGTDLLARGLVPSGRLGGLRSRVLLWVLLAGQRRPDRDEVLRVFARHGA
jgi:L-asparaginase